MPEIKLTDLFQPPCGGNVTKFFQVASKGKYEFYCDEEQAQEMGDSCSPGGCPTRDGEGNPVWHTVSVEVGRSVGNMSAILGRGPGPAARR